MRSRSSRRLTRRRARHRRASCRRSGSCTSTASTRRARRSRRVAARRKSRGRSDGRGCALPQREARAARGRLGARAELTDQISESGRTGPRAPLRPPRVDPSAGRCHEGDESAAARRRRRDGGRGLEIRELEMQGLLGFLELSRGNAAESVRLLEPLPSRLWELGYGEPSHLQAIPNLVDAYVELGSRTTLVRSSRVRAAIACARPPARPRSGRAVPGHAGGGVGRSRRRARTSSTPRSTFGLPRAVRERPHAAREGHRPSAGQAAPRRAGALEEACAIFDRLGAPSGRRAHVASSRASPDDRLRVRTSPPPRAASPTSSPMAARTRKSRPRSSSPSRASRPTSHGSTASSASNRGPS